MGAGPATTVAAHSQPLSGAACPNSEALPAAAAFPGSLAVLDWAAPKSPFCSWVLQWPKESGLHETKVQLYGAALNHIQFIA